MAGPQRFPAEPADGTALLEAVSDPDPAVRFRACRLLDHHELDRSVATRMLAALQDQNKKVRHAALHTLVCEPCKPEGGECFPIDVAGVTVEALRDDRSLRVRRAAAAAMMWQRPMQPRVRRAFHRVLRDESDPELRSKAERALDYDRHCRTTGGQ